MKVDFNSLLGLVTQLTALAALAAAVICLAKVAGVGIPVKGSVQDWLYVAIACAAAKLAR